MAAVRKAKVRLIYYIHTDVQYPAYSTQNVHYGYDTYGRINTKSDGQGSQSYSYDDRDALTSTTTTYTGLPALTIGRTYFPDGSINTITTPVGAYSFGYDAAGRTTTVTNPYSETTTYGYFDNDWLQRQTQTMGLQTAFTYNSVGQLMQLSNTQGGTTLSQFGSFGYDGVGNESSVTVNVPSASSLSGTISYSYDAKNQLKQEQSTRAGGYTNVFGYDNAGNPTTFKGQTVPYNNKNQINAAGFAYDNNGNPTTYNGGTTTFDVSNCLTSFGTFAAGYTAEGLRAWKQSNGNRTYFLYDGDTPLLELGSSGAVLAANTWGANGLISRHTSNGSVFYAFDERGTTTQRLDGIGNILSNRMADAFGKAGGSAATGDPYDGFGGQFGYYSDGETGLQLCTHRYYDPQTGRWLNRDPIGYSGGINLYGYSGNNPVEGIDPEGLAKLIMIGGRFGDKDVPWHYYIKFEHSPGCLGSMTAGFYPKNDGFIDSGFIMLPEPNPVGGTPPGWPNTYPRVIASNPSPKFENALCQCIKDNAKGPGRSKPSKSHPTGSPGQNSGSGYTTGGYMCGEWAADMFDCAVLKSTGSSPRHSVRRYVF